MTTAKSAPRIYFLLAREAPVAVVLRRGPSNRVQMLKWDTKLDTFEKGQWLKGRVYEYRMDLSPSGKYVVYLAANYSRKFDTWTAVSKPPYFTALALWPNMGAWGGGGLFMSDSKLMLNHGVDHMDLVDGFELGKKFRVERWNLTAGRGEDEPINHTRMTRDGWELVDAGGSSGYSSSGRVGWVVSPAQIYRKRARASCGGHVLNRLLLGVNERGGPWYMLEFSITDKDGNQLLDLGRCDCADLDSNGDVLFAREGRIFRLPVPAKTKGGLQMRTATMLVDLNDEKFVEVVPTIQARTW